MLKIKKRQAFYLLKAIQAFQFITTCSLQKTLTFHFLQPSKRQKTFKTFNNPKNNLVNAGINSITHHSFISHTSSSYPITHIHPALYSKYQTSNTTHFSSSSPISNAFSNARSLINVHKRAYTGLLARWILSRRKGLLSSWRGGRVPIWMLARSYQRGPWTFPRRGVEGELVWVAKTDAAITRPVRVNVGVNYRRRYARFYLFPFFCPARCEGRVPFWR